MQRQSRSFICYARALQKSGTSQFKFRAQRPLSSFTLEKGSRISETYTLKKKKSTNNVMIVNDHCVNEVHFFTIHDTGGGNVSITKRVLKIEAKQ